MDIKQYFDESLTLNEGDKIIIPCYNANEQEAIRVQLYRLRATYAKKFDPSISGTLGIYRTSIDDQLVVVIEKRAARQAIIIRSDGTTKLIEEPVSREEDLRRIVAKAVEDGLTVRDILMELEGAYTPQEILNEVVRQKPQESEGTEDGRIGPEQDSREAG